MTTSTVEIMNKGMKCLTEAMGIVEAEQFISIIMREKFDYTNIFSLVNFSQNMLSLSCFFSTKVVKYSC